MSERPVSSRPANLHDTVETTAFAGQTGAAPSGAATGEKVCCSCGKNVSGQKRFKDVDGRYWCYDCGVEDHVRKHPEDGIACAECGGKFAPSKLVSLDDDVYCEACATKQKAQKKREQARIAAAAEEARAQEKRRKLILISVTTLVVVAVALAIWSAMR